jgi:hypothetical protein
MKQETCDKFKEDPFVCDDCCQPKGQCQNCSFNESDHAEILTLAKAKAAIEELSAENEVLYQQVEILTNLCELASKSLQKCGELMAEKDKIIEDQSTVIVESSAFLKTYLSNTRH